MQMQDYPERFHGGGTMSAAETPQEPRTPHGAVDAAGEGPSAAAGSPEAVARFLGAFIDELLGLGVREAVVSPGSRSTPLAMMLEASDIRVTIDIDERGAAFLASGMARASQRPVCLVCTSGTAVGNYLPAVMEAQTSRVPLLVLTGDRPAQLRGLGAPQTCDQLKVFGDAVNLFREMPPCSCDRSGIAFARQVAKEAVLGATEPVPGPVHLNFPFGEPLKVPVGIPDLFSAGRRDLSGIAQVHRRPDADTCACILRLAREGRGVIVCGEGSYPPGIIDLAHLLGAPLLADPLSNLRRIDDAAVIDTYDALFRTGTQPAFDYAIRFGRYPVSKALTAHIAAARPIQVVVDPVATRDFACDTDLFVPCDIEGFVDGILEAGAGADGESGAYLEEWDRLATERRLHLRNLACSCSCTGEGASADDGSRVRAVIESLGPQDVLFCASSLSIRLLDTFLLRGDAVGSILCNRGLNGIDGTLSSALGAAMHHPHATLLCGDLALLHDLDAFHLAERLACNLTVVVSNNNGGGIFQVLPQRSPDPWFEKLFLTPEHVDFGHVAAAFGIGYRRVEDGAALAYTLRELRDGIALVEVPSAVDDVPERFGRYWS